MKQANAESTDILFTDMLADLMKKVEHGDGKKVHERLTQKGVSLSYYMVNAVLCGKRGFREDVWTAFAEFYAEREKERAAKITAISNLITQQQNQIAV